MTKKTAIAGTLPEQMMSVLDRLAAGEDLNKIVEETGITARVSEAIQAQNRPAFVVLQEGGSSTEMYLHSHETAEAAEAARVDCARASYRTSSVIEVPGAVAALGEVFYQTVEEIIRSIVLDELDYAEGQRGKL